MHFEVNEIGALLKDFLAIICFISFIKATHVTRYSNKVFDCVGV